MFVLTKNVVRNWQKYKFTKGSSFYHLCFSHVWIYQNCLTALGVFIHIFLWISPIPLVWYCLSDLRKVVQMSSSIGNSRHPSALMVIFRPFLAIFLTTTFISFTKLPIAWRKNCLSTQNSFLLWNCLSCLPENRKYIHIRKLVKLSNYLLTMYW